MQIPRVQPGLRAAVCSERGVSMLFALMTLVALSLAAVALVRSVNTGTLVVGNLGFKQDTTAYAEQASEAAIAYLSDQISGTTLNANVTAEGYYATSYQELDATNRTPAVTTRAVVDWAGDACAAYTAGSFAGGCLTPKVSVAANGNTTRYLITRLCSAALSATDPANVCAGPLTTSAAASTEKGGIDYANPTRFGVPGAGPYFRIVVRATGARNTTTYTETIVHF